MRDVAFALRRYIPASFELPVQRAPVETEHLCGQRLVSAHGLEDAQDIPALDLFHRQKLRRIVALDSDARALELAHTLGQIVDADVVELRESDRALDAVLQLAHVARPRVREQLVGRVALDPHDPLRVLFSSLYIKKIQL